MLKVKIVERDSAYFRMGMGLSLLLDGAAEQLKRCMSSLRMLWELE